MSSDAPTGAYVWTWLPGASEPVVCGRIDEHDEDLWFTYGSSYLSRSDAIPLQPSGLPLRPGPQRPDVPGAHGVVRDAAPDAWGMRVILRRLVGGGADDVDALSLLTYLRESGSNRIGALDVQDAADTHEPRTAQGNLDELLDAAERIEQGQPFSEDLDLALALGTSVGGARPKALLTGGDVDGSEGRGRDGDGLSGDGSGGDGSGGDGAEFIAKFSVSTDVFPWVQAEAIGMELARRCGLDVAATRLVRAAGRDVLLVTRFDRPGGGRRRSVLSGLTLLGLHELAARHASYVDLAELVRLRFTNPTETLHELFARIVVNVLVGNTDDHARNHAAFFDGDHLTLTPAYDVTPQPRSTGEATQAMAHGLRGERAARLASVIASAPVYGLTAPRAQDVVDRCRTIVAEQFDDVCASVGASEVTRDLLRGRAVLNPSVDHPDE